MDLLTGHQSHFVTWLSYLIISSRLSWWTVPILYADCQHGLFLGCLWGVCIPHFLHILCCSLTTETNAVLEQKRWQKSAGVTKGQIPPPQTTNCPPRPSLRESCQGMAVGWALVNPHCRFPGHHRGAPRVYKVIYKPDIH